jgi:hypothetical protein
MTKVHEDGKRKKKMGKKMLITHE